MTEQVMKWLLSPHDVSAVMQKGVIVSDHWSHGWSCWSFNRSRDNAVMRSFIPDAKLQWFCVSPDRLSLSSSGCSVVSAMWQCDCAPSPTVCAEQWGAESRSLGYLRPENTAPAPWAQCRAAEGMRMKCCWQKAGMGDHHDQQIYCSPSAGPLSLRGSSEGFLSLQSAHTQWRHLRRKWLNSSVVSAASVVLAECVLDHLGRLVRSGKMADSFYFQTAYHP